MNNIFLAIITMLLSAVAFAGEVADDTDNGIVISSSTLIPDRKGRIVVCVNPGISQKDDFVAIGLTLKFLNSASLEGPSFEDIKIKLDSSHEAVIALKAESNKQHTFHGRISGWDEMTGFINIYLTHDLKPDEKITKIVLSTKGVESVNKIVWYDTFNK